MDIPKEILFHIDANKAECEEYRNAFFDYLDNHSAEDTVQRYFFYGMPFVFRNDENKFIELKKDIAKWFKIDPSDVYMVGSSKLGFSLSPQKNYRDWTEDSDIDIAIINDDLFDRYWNILYREPVTLVPRFEKDDENFKSFLSYFFIGWLRPDLMPDIEKHEWFTFFSTLHGKYGYKITAGIYRKKDFFKTYHVKNLIRIKEERREWQ